MRKLVVTFTVAAAAALALAACGGSSSSSTTSSSPATNTSAGGGGGGGGNTTSGGSSSVSISANPSGQLAFEQSSVSAKAGNVTVDFTNQSPVGHDVCVQDSSGKDLGCTSVIQGQSTSKTFNNLKPGSYTFFCSVDSHEQAGMKGTLKVQ
jgi:plastocyanin